MHNASRRGLLKTKTALPLKKSEAWVQALPLKKSRRPGCRGPQDPPRRGQGPSTPPAPFPRNPFSHAHGSICFPPVRLSYVSVIPYPAKEPRKEGGKCFPPQTLVGDRGAGCFPSLAPSRAHCQVTPPRQKVVPCWHAQAETGENCLVIVTGGASQVCM